MTVEQPTPYDEMVEDRKGTWWLEARERAVIRQEAYRLGWKEAMEHLQVSQEESKCE